MRKIEVTGTTVYAILTTFSTSINYQLGLPVVEIKSIEKPITTFRMVINSIDASIWNLPQSVFNNNEKLKKVLIVKGWISEEKNKKLSDSTTKKCTLRVYTKGILVLHINKKSQKNKKPKIKKK